ncbi:hypothetical protein DCAR_0832146 [Daucus carota subsp. sativus]|uniref:Uncharacterized protein n=1 Tax=Daucus carota subsp. sativus TaxID=79200 RepID=A0A175YQT4_DAUCS|nr:hypothetical protein DCAR_0832146 [Daucus carota subsp. sativus]
MGFERNRNKDSIMKKKKKRIGDGGWRILIRLEVQYRTNPSLIISWNCFDYKLEL